MKTSKNSLSPIKEKLELFTSLKFDASKYSKEYLDFLNALIFALLSAEVISIQQLFVRNIL
ncbi:hypothetical protein lpari_02128 [Legionella parisiensis]|uniref:Uncharacterized protein n=1 Tax=Legionella parisiensis TaxID=45071 RepID=A0A1E5JQV2_9GAMM|nr:hypothetical protein lpari_02128 [Legionella parisiensis]